MKDTCFKDIVIRLQILITTLHPIVKIIGRTYVFSYKIYIHALLIIVTKVGDVRFSI